MKTQRGGFFGVLEANGRHESGDVDARNDELVLGAALIISLPPLPVGHRTDAACATLLIDR